MVCDISINNLNKHQGALVLMKRYRYLRNKSGKKKI